ncbi:MarR family transcriptional regulator [Actinoplanes philippinensis]|uniref:DNA-binding transcriptional regulator, MarR family n=1 Tax=Actinoplanes philippinensis TaxID=35752 RepID=A0A1I2MH87_9ACTN|nr:MarR family transcriptional regulator [Actinoplanes philippinensis]GIE83151.1 MarR family transcriptional regulator [Actinoplanes philippinensis]SFF90368.1 DNA-binding transcriptional regulator, MarR family [Actinoplanes philippinensis]
MEPETDLVERWRSLLNSYNEVACHLERVLHDTHGLTLSEYETLDRLTTQECEQRRMQDLAEQMYLSQSALSRTVSRLVNGGLAERTSCQADRRQVFVEITEAGRQRWAEARRTHLGVLAEHLSPAAS